MKPQCFRDISGGDWVGTHAYYQNPWRGVPVVSGPWLVSKQEPAAGDLTKQQRQRVEVTRGKAAGATGLDGSCRRECTWRGGGDYHGRNVYKEH
jgi:hypothetical protein